MLLCKCDTVIKFRFDSHSGPPALLLPTGLDFYKSGRSTAISQQWMSWFLSLLGQGLSAWSLHVLPELARVFPLSAPVSPHHQLDRYIRLIICAVPLTVYHSPGVGLQVLRIG